MASLITLSGVPVSGKRPPLEVSDEVWDLLEPLLPVSERRLRYSGRRRSPDPQALRGILFVLRTGIPWMRMAQELRRRSGFTCWWRLEEWQQAGAWDELHAVLLTRLWAPGEIEWSRAVVDGSRMQASKGPPRRARSIGAETGRSTHPWSTAEVRRSRSR